MVLLLLFSNHPLIEIDSDTFFVLELFKEAWECGYNNNNVKENGKDYQRVFDTEALIHNLMRENSKGHCPAH